MSRMRILRLSLPTNKKLEHHLRPFDTCHLARRSNHDEWAVMGVAFTVSFGDLHEKFDRDLNPYENSFGLV